MHESASAPRFELVLGDEHYPEILASTPDPPRVLYGVGSRDALGPALGVIGARQATPYGLRAAELFAGWAGSAGYRVVSGAARGCDAAAQVATLESGGITVAVLGCGADVDYPRSSVDLLALLRAGAGAVISELPWGTPPARWAFARRNRIIAGLSKVLLVVEAGLPSGTFSTADYALDASRDVLVVPGSIFAPECRGVNRLLHQGARPVTDVSDLAFELQAALGAPAVTPAEQSTAEAPSEDDPIVRAVNVDPMRPDDIARALAMDIVTVTRRVASLEADGVVQRYADGRYGPRKRR